MKRILAALIVLWTIGPTVARSAVIDLSKRAYTAPASYTATYSSLTNATAVTKWYRDGRHLYISGKVTWSGAGGVGAFTVDLPGAEAGSPLIDTSMLVGGTGTSSAAATMLGPLGYWFDNGSGWTFIVAKYVDTNTVGFFMNTQVLDGSQFASGDSLNFEIKAPIVGWN